MARKKFNDNDVRQIRASEDSARAIARRYGVSFPTILDIRHHRTYKCVPAIVDDPTKSPIIRDNQFIRTKAMTLMNILPAGYCQTVVTSIPRDLRNPWVHDEKTQQIYAKWKQKVLEECLRVAGPQGIVICHQVGTNPNRPSELSNSITINTGEQWSIPKQSRVANINTIIASFHQMPPQDPEQVPAFPEDIVDTCLSLGSQRVLDPFANTGAVPLAAIRAGRTWLAADMRTDLMSEFRRRKEDLTTRISTGQKQ